MSRGFSSAISECDSFQNHPFSENNIVFLCPALAEHTVFVVSVRDGSRRVRSQRKSVDWGTMAPALGGATRYTSATHTFLVSYRINYIGMTIFEKIMMRKMTHAPNNFLSLVGVCVPWSQRTADSWSWPPHQLSTGTSCLLGTWEQVFGRSVTREVIRS